MLQPPVAVIALGANKKLSKKLLKKNSGVKIVHLGFCKAPIYSRESRRSHMCVVLCTVPKLFIFPGKARRS